LPNRPGKPYFDRLSQETDFNRDTLEKVFRLLDLLKDIIPAPDIEGKLVLKGGTAIQFIYTGLKRLSVDVDFNYIGSLDRVVMKEDRGKIGGMLARIFREHDYTFNPPRGGHSEEQHILSYTNTSGNRDRIKVEINYSERLPALPLESKRVTHPFDILEDIKVLTYPFEELWASKTRALLTRGSPRDLYDVHLLSQYPGEVDRGLHRKLTIFYLCLMPKDVRKLTTEKINAIDETTIRRKLLPMLQRRDHRVDLETLKGSAMKVVKPILTFDKNEKKFFDLFYDERKFDQGLLFGGYEIDSELETHPVVQWRLEQ